MLATTPQAVTRRTVLTGALAMSALPVWARTLPTNPDVIVIGAGSAGLSAEIGRAHV
jgi:ribulose 1,5-bisphosphate synthetase/thiazole synthase